MNRPSAPAPAATSWHALLATHTLSRRAPHVPYKESIGTRLRRTTYHYWYHTGESQAAVGRVIDAMFDTIGASIKKVL